VSTGCLKHPLGSPDDRVSNCIKVILGVISQWCSNMAKAVICVLLPFLVAFCRCAPVVSSIAYAYGIELTQELAPFLALK